MYLYCTLLFCLAVLWFIAWRMYNFELFSPVSINTMVFAIGVLLAIAGLLSWNQIDLQFDGFLIILLGCISFAVGGLLVAQWVQVLCGKSKPIPGTVHGAALQEKDDTTTQRACPVPITRYWKIVVLLLLMLLAFGAWLYESYQMAAETGMVFDTYSAFSKWVRSQTVSFATNFGNRLDEGYSVFERVVSKLGAVSTMICVVFFGATLRDSTRRKECALYGTGYLLACILLVLRGSRGGVLSFTVCVLIVAYLVDLRQGKVPLTLSKKYTLGVVLVAMVGVPTFFALGAAVGRAPGSDLVEYISFYFGGGIPALQYALDEGINDFTLPGGATFHGVYSLLYKVHLVESIPAYASHFIYLGGHGINIFTAYYRYFVDFGYAGLILLSAFAGAITTAFYEVAKRSDSTLLFVWYAYWSQFLFDGQRDEYVFGQVVSASCVIQFVLLGLFILILYRHIDRAKVLRMVRMRYGRVQLASDCQSTLHGGVGRMQKRSEPDALKVKSVGGFGL